MKSSERATPRHRSFARRATYSATRVLSRLLGRLFFGFRFFGAENWPTSGGALACANHQSYFDPVLVGMSCDRQLNYLARKSLFKFFLFRWLIQWYDAIPVERDGMGIAGIKETLRRVRGGEIVVIFPEGTRTADGNLQPLAPGFCAIARRMHGPLVPVGIDGAYDAWPRTSRWPRLTPIHVHIGVPLSTAEIGEMEDDQLVAEMSARIAACHAAARKSRQKK